MMTVEPWTGSIPIENEWGRCKRKIYEVHIQRTVRGSEYNVPGQADVVYNFLEQSYESTLEADYIVTGTLGEMWPIKSSKLSSYNIDGKSISDFPQKCQSIADETEYYYTQISADKKFNLMLSDGIVLKGNSEGVDHGEGDYLVCTSMEMTDCRIVNGIVFEKTFERID